jgi:hypothetical protein
MGSMCPTCRNRRDDGLFSHQPKMLLSGAREKAPPKRARFTFLRRIWTTLGDRGAIEVVHVALVGMISHRPLSGCETPL